jgi:hypothetical protein
MKLGCATKANFCHSNNFPGDFEQVHDAITKVFKARGGCYHLFVDVAYGSPIGTEERMEMEEMDDDEDEEDFVPYDQYEFDDLAGDDFW